MKARRGQLVRCYGSVENTEIIGGAVESVNESISTLMNRSKCSLVAFDYMYRTWMVLLSEVERKPSYSAVAVDGPIYFKKTKSYAAVVLSVNESISTLMNRSKCSLVAFDYMYQTWMVLLSEVIARCFIPRRRRRRWRRSRRKYYRRLPMTAFGQNPIAYSW